MMSTWGKGGARVDNWNAYAYTLSLQAQSPYRIQILPQGGSSISPARRARARNIWVRRGPECQLRWHALWSLKVCKNCNASKSKIYGKSTERIIFRHKIRIIISTNTILYFTFGKKMDTKENWFLFSASRCIVSNSGPQVNGHFIQNLLSGHTDRRRPDRSLYTWPLIGKRHQHSCETARRTVLLKLFITCWFTAKWPLFS